MSNGDQDFDLEQQVGARIRELRKRQGWSQEQLGQHIGTGSLARQSTIAKLEAGQRPLRLNEAVVIAQTLRVPFDLLLDAAQEPERKQAAQAVADARHALDSALKERTELEQLLDSTNRHIERWRDELARAKTALRIAEQREAAGEEGAEDGKPREEA